jgi:DNA-binding HxlR family transcriptional regulator
MTSSDLPYQKGLAAAVYLLRGKWHVPVMTALIPDRRRFSDLLTAVNQVHDTVAGPLLSEKVLTGTLKQMMTDGMIARSEPTGPFEAVWYELTDLGRSLLEAVRPLADWAQQYPQALAEVGSRRPNGRAIDS